MTSRRNQSDRYRQGIAPYLEEWAERGFDDWQQFRNWSVQQVLWDYNLTPSEIEDITRIDGPRDKGIDGWYYDADDARLILIQSKDGQISRADFSKTKDGFLDVILNRPGIANQSLRDKASIFREGMPQYFNLDIYLTTSSIAQQDLQPNEDGGPYISEPLLVGEAATALASYYVRDIKFLAANLQVIHNRPVDCTFHVAKQSFFQFSVGGHTRTVSAAIKGTELASLFSREKENLFRKNPRYYLRMSTRSKEIKDSLREHQNENFFVFNNGLTCIAQSISIREEHPEYTAIDLDDFQIVNGCQTVASLGSVAADISRVYVLAKIVENPRAGARDDSLSETIAVRSNTQNPLKAEDWKANDRRQEILKDKFRRLPEPWFYEIKRGVWATEYRSTTEREPFFVSQEQRERIPLTYRKVGMKDLAQVCYAFIGHPAEALDKAREIFNDDLRYQIVFPADLEPSQLLLPYLIYLGVDRYRLQHPNYTLEDTDVEINTEHLRFPVVNAVGRVLNGLAGRPQGYFSPEQSDELIRTQDKWQQLFIERCFWRLARKLAMEAHERGSGPRSIVRRNEWMIDPINDAVDLIRERLRMESEFAPGGQGLVSASLPFEVH